MEPWKIPQVLLANMLSKASLHFKFGNKKGHLKLQNAEGDSRKPPKQLSNEWNNLLNVESFHKYIQDVNELKTRLYLTNSNLPAFIETDNTEFVF